MSRTVTFSDAPVPEELWPYHAPKLKIVYERRRIPFLIVTFLGVIFSLASVFVLPMSMRLLGVGGFSLLIMATFLFYSAHRNAYEKWKHLDIGRIREGSDGSLELEMDFHEAFKEEGKRILGLIEDAVVKHDTVELGQQAHKLKGSALTIGYPEVAYVSLRIESLCQKSELTKASALVPRLQRLMATIDQLMVEYFSIRTELDKKESKKDR